jgi:hypothetical protein
MTFHNKLSGRNVAINGKSMQKFDETEKFKWPHNNPIR